MLACAEVFKMGFEVRSHELGEAYACDLLFLIDSFLSYTQVISGPFECNGNSLFHIIWLFRYYLFPLLIQEGLNIWLLGIVSFLLIG